MHRVRNVIGRLVRFGAIAAQTALLVGALGSAGTAQESPCELIAPWELTEMTGAAFGPGEASGSSCTWRTETRDGHILTITLDASEQPPDVTFVSDDPAVDGRSSSEALSALVAQRVAAGVGAPAAPSATGAAGDRPDLCELFPADEVAALMGVKVKPYGSLGADACGYLGDEPGRILVDVLVTFESGSLSDIPTDWPDAIEVRILELSGLEYGWDLGTSQTAYLSVDTEAGLLTAKVSSDTADLDPSVVARVLVEDVLAAMGHEPD